MLKIDEIQNPRSCLNKAADNEPVFVLRANDEVAARAIRYWAGLYLADKESKAPLTQRQQAKYFEALALADKMDQWRQLR